MGKCVYCLAGRYVRDVVQRLDQRPKELLIESVEKGEQKDLDRLKGVGHIRRSGQEVYV